MKRFKDYEVLVEEHAYSSVQVKMPICIGIQMMELAASIPDEDLAEDGRDMRPHITIKYGLHSTNPDIIKNLELPERITVILGKTSLFRTEDADVLKIDVDSDDLVRLNKLITDKTENTTTYSEYNAHATIAYLKPGKGEPYVGDDRFDGITWTFNNIEFSSKDDDEYISISLRN